MIEAYRDRMPVEPGWKIVTLGEGGTPLLPAPHLSDRAGCEVFLKVDGANPTGSFKDRGMTMAVTDALARGKQGVICASTGNTSASAAAYAARAGMTCAVLVPQGKIALGKLAQAVAHGARILQIDGNFDDCLELARKTAADYPVAALVNSVNPTRIAGQASAAYEICDVLGRAPDVHCLPVGNAGNITAYWAGYRAYRDDGADRRRAADVRLPGRRRGAAGARRAGARTRRRSPPRSGSGRPRRGPQAVTARDESGGRFAAVTDDEILAAYRLLSAREAVFVEPASAASVAGLLQSAADGDAAAGSLVVCTVTGHGLKDPDTALLTAPDADGGADRPGGGGRRAGAAVTRGRHGSAVRLLRHGRRWVGPPRSGSGCRPRRRTSGPGSTRWASRSALYDEVEVAVAPDGADGRGRRRGRRPGAPRRARTSSSAPCAARWTVVRRRAARPAPALPQRDPARPRPGQFGRRRGRGRGGGRGARGPRRRSWSASVAAGHGRHGGARGQRGGEPARRVRRRVGDRGNNDDAVRRCTARRAPGHPPGRARRGGRVVSPATTRGLLPDQVPLADAAFTGSRTALAVLAFTQRPDLLLPATADRLHQEYRRPAYPESAALVDALRATGRPGRRSPAPDRPSWR